MKCLKRFIFIFCLCLCAFSAKNASADFNLYWQYDYTATTSWIATGGNSIATTFSDVCDTSGVVKWVRFMMQSDSDTEITLLWRIAGNSYQDWTATTTLSATDYPIPVIFYFDYSTSTPPLDLSSCPTGFQSNFFQLTNDSGGSFRLFGTLSATTSGSLISLPLAAACVEGAELRCNGVKNIFMNINGDLSPTDSWRTDITTIATIPKDICEDMGAISCYDIKNIYKCVGGAICKVLSFLFLPSQDKLDQFFGLKDLLLQKPPFGYFVSIKNSLSSLSASTTPIFELASAGEIGTSIFTPLKTGLSWVLWLLFGFYIIKRIGAFIF
jgi:hypothetical protein